MLYEKKKMSFIVCINTSAGYLTLFGIAKDLWKLQWSLLLHNVNQFWISPTPI